MAERERGLAFSGSHNPGRGSQAVERKEVPW